MKTTVCFFLIFLCFIGTASASNNPEKMLIEVSLSECKLRLYELENGEKVLLKEYDAATVKRGVISPLGKGKITKIEFNPTWYPTKLSQETLKKNGIIVGSSVPPGSKNNYMGTFKIHLSHSTYKGAIYRIHGNNDDSKIGQRVTGGCIRMHNEEGEELARIVPVGTEVVINK